MALLVKVQKVKNKGLGTKWYGKTVKRQDVTIESETVDNKSDYRIDEHVKKVKCKFTPSSHRVQGGKLSYYFCEGVELERCKE